jgi:plasmid stabilization system protein ParE
MKRVWSRRAIRHLVALRDFIAQEDARAAGRIARRILDGVELAASQPHIGRTGREAGTRELVIAGTSYGIPYRVRGGRFEIVAVFHGPQRWPEHF